MRWTMSVAVIGAGLWGGCAAPPPESACSSDMSSCAEPTPICNYSTRRCTRSCTSSADCGELDAQTSCDLGVRMCTLPCTADEPASYACIGGERVFCATDPSLPCTACPGVCTADQFCDATATCTPKRAAGEPCVTADECLSNDCMPTGTCAVGQGEPCTPATCDGACAMSPSGETFCIRRGCPANCEAMTTGGYQWTCVSYWDQTYTYCVPLEDCIWQDPCATFANSTCGQSCGTTGRCITYCVPDELPRN